MANPPSLSILTRSNELQARLQRACAGMPSATVVVGFLYEGREYYAVTSREPDASHFVAPGSRDTYVGCLMKVFNATLVAQMVGEGRLSPTDEVTDLFRLRRSRAADSFRGITLEQLLNHTHGLDGSGLSHVHRRTDGYIDFAELIACLSAATPLADPGELYSYGNAGAWLAAAVMEQLLQRPYEEILIERLLSPLRIPLRMGPQLSPRISHPDHLCPAVGGPALISVRELLQFLKYHMTESPDTASKPAWLTVMRRRPVPPPGWSLEQGICPGWKYQGDGWYGHFSNLKVSSAIVRFQPQEQIGIVIASDSDCSFVVLARLFARFLPVFLQMKLPQLLDSSASGRTDLRQYVGIYQNEAQSIVITQSAQSCLRVELCARRGARAEAVPGGGTFLQTTDINTFVAEDPHASGPVFAQFIHPSAGGTFRYIWNGQSVFRRA